MIKRIAIAEGIAGSIEGFCDLMNEYAKEIGILDSHFESPHGLDSQNHYSTAYDLAMLTSKTKQIDFLMSFQRQKNTQILDFQDHIKTSTRFYIWFLRQQAQRQDTQVRPVNV